MLLRIVSAVVGAPLLLLAVYFGGVPLIVMVLALEAVAALELARLWPKALNQPAIAAPWYIAAAVVPTVGGVVAAHWGSQAAVYGVTAGLLVALLIAGAAQLWHGGEDPRAALVGASGIAAAAVYLGLPFSHMQLFDALPSGAAWITWVLVVVWSSDIGAYFGGMRLGGPKLAPRISPGKTWSGAVTGLLAAAVFGWIAARVLGLMFVASSAFALLPAVVALLLAAFGIAGDLTESVLKRAAAVKDAGALIPGHGGVLDRFDSLLFVLPVAYWLVWFYHV